MKLWNIIYTLIDEPNKHKSWPHLEAFDFGEATTMFRQLLVDKLGMSEDDFSIVDIKEIKA